MKKLLEHPLFSGSVIMVGGNMLANAINYIYHLVMGRVLGPTDYGVLASLYSILYLISVIPSSASVAIVKFISAAKNESETFSVYRSLRKFIFYLAVTASFLLIISSFPIAKFLNIKSVGSVFLIGLVLLFSLITLVNQATAQGLLKFTGSIVPNITSAIVKFAVGVGLVFLGWSVFGAMIGVLLGAILAYLYSAWFIGKFLKKSEVKQFNIKPFLKFSLPVLVQAFAFTSLFTSDVILVKHFLPAFDAGIYAALSTLGKIIFFAASPISATMFPIVSGRNSRGEAYQKVFFVSLAITLLMSAGIVVFYWLFPNIAIGVLYGKAYLSAKSELVWMGFFLLLYTLSYFLVNFSLSLGRTKVVFLPLAAALVQISAVWFFHKNLLQIIQISLTVTAFLFFVLVVYLGYNQVAKRYAKVI